MRRSEAHQGVRMMKFLDILGRYEARSSVSWKRRSFWALASGRFGAGASARGRRRSGLVGPAAWQSFGQAGSGGPGGGGGGALSGPLQRLHGEAFSRVSGARSLVRVGLHLDEDVSALEGLAGEGEEARRASAQAAAPAIAGDDAASGRLAARMARRPAGARSDRDDGRCHEHDLFGLSG